MASQMAETRGRQPNPIGRDQAQQSGGLSPESPWDPWKHPHLQVQNTFLTISPPLSETLQGFMEVRRQTSDPTSSRSSSLSSSQHSQRQEEAAAAAAGSRARGARFSRERKQNRSQGDSDDGSRSASESSKDQRAQAGGIDGSGESTSIGSALHAEGKCKPCAFHPTSSGCAMGAECRFCHLSHKTSGKIRLRPCKGKRMRTKRMFDRLTTQIRKDPENFDPSTLDLPPSIEQNSVVKSRLIGRLTEYADQARAGRSSASEGEEFDEEEEDEQHGSSGRGGSSGLGASGRGGSSGPGNAEGYQ